MNKKAISPLIATILLIVVAVALIAIVLTWGKSFTQDSLAETTDIVDTACAGAAIQVSDCSISNDNLMVFYVRNIGTTYTFPAEDIFTIDVVGDNSKYASGVAINHDAGVTWAGLAPGSMTQVKLDLTDVDGDISGGTFYDVTVKSAYCPSDAVASLKKCHK